MVVPTSARTPIADLDLGIYGNTQYGSRSGHLTPVGLDSGSRICGVDSTASVGLTPRRQAPADEPLEATPSRASVGTDGDLGDLFQVFHPDGSRYEPGEWPLLRSLKTGEVVVDEQFFSVASDGGRRRFADAVRRVARGGSAIRRRGGAGVSSVGTGPATRSMT